MNIKTFLIENYIWLIVIILITIITIIGFLADKKRGGKKEKKVQDTQIQNVNNQPVNASMMNNQQLNTQTPIQYQQPQEIQANQTNSNIGMNFNQVNEVGNPSEQINNNVLEPQPMTYTQPQDMTSINNVIETNNNPQPVENIASNIIQEPMYQPLSEQKPVFEPKPIPNFSSIQTPPVNTDFNQINSIQNKTTASNIAPINTPTMPTQTEYIMNQTPINNNQVNQQPQMIQNNNFSSIPNVVSNNTTIPQPVNPIPQPNIVMPQAMMQNNYNQQGMIPQNINQQKPVGQQNLNMAQPGQTLNQQPINFVYGPQNNNQNM